MEENIKEMCDNTIKSINDFENYLFKNELAKYLTAKTILDDLKKRIRIISKSYNENTKEQYNEALHDLTLISKSIHNNKLDDLVPTDTVDINYFLNNLNQLVQI